MWTALFTDSCADFNSIINKDGGCLEDIKSRIATAQCIFSQLKQFGRIGKYVREPRLEYSKLQ